MRPVLLCIHRRDRRYVDHFFRSCSALQYVDWPAHAHQNRPDQLSSADSCRQFARQVGRGQVGEDQHIRPALQRTERIELFDQLGSQRLGGHDFAVDN